MKSLTTKLLISIGIVAIFFSVFLFYQVYSLTNRRISDVVEQQAAMALKFDLAIRQYIAQNVRPLMYELLGDEEFIPETMSTSYVARSVFEDVRNEFPDYIIKFSSDNPRNPVNQAGPEELKIIEYFNNNPHLKRWEGIISMGDKKYMAKFSARRMKDSCLRCHGDPKDAPASLLKRYGSTAGFHRPIGQVIGMDTVAIPMTKISEKLWSEFITTFIISGLGLLFFFGVIVLITRFLIINRLSIISQHFTYAAQESNYSKIKPIKMDGKDEIGNLAYSFNVLSEKLKNIYSSLDVQVKERTKELENTNDQLMQEINERKKAEEELKKERDRSQKYLDVAGVMLLALDAEQNVTMINKKGCEILGYEEHEIVGKNWFDHFIGAENIEEIKEVFNKIISGDIEPVEYFENSVLTKGGSEKIMAWHNSIVKEEPAHIVSILSSGEDITKRKHIEQERDRLEDQIVQAQKIESIGTLAGGIAHDFNNILYPIIGYTELTIGDVPKNSRTHKNLEEILKAAMRAGNLVQQILTFSRKGDQENKPVMVQLVVKEALKLIRASIPKTIDIHQEIDKNCELVMGDPTQIHQIVMNLCTNAYHAMEDAGGKLEVTLTEIEIATDGQRDKIDLNPGRYLQLSVSDNGHGMTPDIISRIFDPYYTTKKSGKGTGLGLSVTHGIVKNHGGSISVLSEPGIGTTFHVYLPLIEKETKLVATETPEIIPMGSERILLVDDEESIVIMEQQMLERLGYNVTPRSSSVEALEAFKSNPDNFDLIITDMTMPNMTGVQLAQKIKNIKADIPIIICTGFSEQLTTEKCQAIGINGLVMKPVIIKELAGTIRRVLDAPEES